MTKWTPLNIEPKEPMVVVLFYGMRARLYEETNLDFAWDWSLPENRALLCDVAYWTGSEWRESGTNHDVFELGAKLGDPDKPTHWSPLLAAAEQPPATNTSDSGSTPKDNGATHD